MKIFANTIFSIGKVQNRNNFGNLSSGAKAYSQAPANNLSNENLKNFASRSYLSSDAYIPCNFSAASQSKLQIQTVNYTNDLKADLFRIPSDKEVPAVILIHGGYWSAGSRKELSDFAAKLANKGYLAMTIDYHLLPKYKQATQTEDATKAIWWLRENSKKLGVNPNKIGVVGVSAGGYLAAWTATHDKERNGTHSRPNAVISVCGPWDLSKEAEKEISKNGIKLVKAFCKGEDRKLASPQYSITSSVPPVLLIHGDADTTVPVSQSIKAHKQLQAQHCNSELIIVPNDKHIAPNSPTYFIAIDKSIDFLDKILK